MRQSLHGIESDIWILFLISADSTRILDLIFFLYLWPVLTSQLRAFLWRFICNTKPNSPLTQVVWFICLLRQGKWEVNNMKNIWKRWKPISSHWRRSKHSGKPVLVILSTPLLTMSILTIDFCKLSKNPGVFFLKIHVFY